jgi:hypothetical protein
MALSASLLERTVVGNKQVQVYSCVADAATGTVETNMNGVAFFSVVHKSMTSGAGKFKMNVDASGTASPGMIAITGVANGDEFYLTVYGS